LRYVLLHTAGVPGLPHDTAAEDLCDRDRMCAALADEEAWWEPGTRFGYHAKSFGFVLGEIIRRVTWPASRWGRWLGNQVTNADFYACGRPESGSERRHGGVICRWPCARGSGSAPGLAD